MQAVKAYYDGSRFIPYEQITIPKGSQVIVTILDEPTHAIKGQLQALDALCSAIDAAIDEEMPPIEPVRLREVEV